jgi:hypothetical protein
MFRVCLKAISRIAVADPARGGDSGIPPCGLPWKVIQLPEISVSGFAAGVCKGSRRKAARLIAILMLMINING